MNIFYSPKGHINQLWKEIYKFSATLNQYERCNIGENVGLAKIKHEIEKRENLISALITCYLDSENNKDYINEHQP